MSANGKRKRRPAADKLRIVLASMEPGVEVSDLCRREGIAPTQFYGWKKKLLGAAEKIFGNENLRQSADERKRQELLQRKDAVIAEITAENLELKKGLSA